MPRPTYAAGQRWGYKFHMYNAVDDRRASGVTSTRITRDGQARISVQDARPTGLADAQLTLSVTQTATFGAQSSVTVRTIPRTLLLNPDGSPPSQDEDRQAPDSSFFVFPLADLGITAPLRPGQHWTARLRGLAESLYGLAFQQRFVPLPDALRRCAFVGDTPHTRPQQALIACASSTDYTLVATTLQGQSVTVHDVWVEHDRYVLGVATRRLLARDYRTNDHITVTPVHARHPILVEETRCVLQIGSLG
jgi:hypothetical protein